MISRKTLRITVAAAAALAGCLLAVAPAAAGASAASPGVLRLSGVLHLTKGTCFGGKPAGSYLSVTFGTKAIGNPASDCEGGAVTLLAPGSSGLSTQHFSPTSDEAFDAHGNAVSSAIARPVAFGKHVLGLVSASQDLQDAPTGGPLFSLPHLYVTGDKVLADVRSLQVLYGGSAGTTCATGAGAGCWLIGAERATGTYDAQTHRVTLSWFTGQSFVPQSAGTAVHLSGVFEGAAPKPVKHGTVVDLGTSSFAAGPAPTPSDGTKTGATRAHRTGSAGHRTATTGRVVASDTAASSNRWLPETFAAALLLILAASYGAAFRKGSS